MIACVVGGSNGVGAGIVQNLLSRGCEKLYILDIEKPIIVDNRIEYKKINLTNCDSSDCYFDDVDVLVLTAGIGRLNYFEDFDNFEISTTFNINTITPIQIINKYYDKINSPRPFYCAILSSIAGIVNSPLYALYSATKASLCKFIEAINTELHYKGYTNRILNVAPGKINGTKFHGGFTDLESIQPLSNSIVEKMLERVELYVPHYEVYCNVINRYNANPTEFGLESIEYKFNNNVGLQSAKKVKVGYLSGTFDLFHIGHLNILKKARENCDYLIVGVHRDASHKNKETFISFDERVSIVGACKYVDKVVESPKEDSDAWDKYRYDVLFVGSDYKGSERFAKYEEYLKDKAQIVYFDYTKTTSSSQLRNALENLNRKAKD